GRALRCLQGRPGIAGQAGGTRGRPDQANGSCALLPDVSVAGRDVVGRGSRMNETSGPGRSSAPALITGPQSGAKRSPEIEPMTAKQYRKALDELNLSIGGDAPYVLAISRRTSQRFAAKGEVPGPVERLLQMLRKHGIPPEWQPPEAQKGG